MPTTPEMLTTFSTPSAPSTTTAPVTSVVQTLTTTEPPNVAITVTGSPPTMSDPLTTEPFTGRGAIENIGSANTVPALGGAIGGIVLLLVIIAVVVAVVVVLVRIKKFKLRRDREGDRANPNNMGMENAIYGAGQSMIVYYKCL